jgi:hypothetical protein
MALLGSIGKSLYKGATSKLGATAIIGTAAATGMYQTAGQPAMDAAMDIAFDNPNADELFVGEKLSPLIFGGAAIGRNG